MMDHSQVNDRSVLVFLAGTASAALIWAAIRWAAGRSLFGFESPYWDLGLIPALVVNLLAVTRLGSTTGPRRRFLVGFLGCGSIAATAYAASCSRPARWSMISALQPFQTGFMLAPEMKMSLADLRPWGIFVDSAILVLIPILPALLGGLVAAVRMTLRRMMVAVAIIAVLLGGVTATIRRARYQDQMGSSHRRQIVGVRFGRPGLDGKLVYELPGVDPMGNTLSPSQQRLDRWHEAMAQRYWHASFYPWSATVREAPPPE